MELKRVLGIANTWFSDRSYRRDAELVRKYTGAKLTKEQFELYRGQFTLRGIFGTNNDINLHYNKYGTSRQCSRIYIMNDILNELSGVGIVFDIEKQQNEELFNRLLGVAVFCLTQDRWPEIPTAYRQSPRLNAEVVRARSKMRLGYRQYAI